MHMGHIFPFTSNSIMTWHGAGLYLKFGYFVQHVFFAFILIFFQKNYLMKI